ncbi:MAG: hypothetical protein HKN23_02805 [Verrucomicrobiales bacterium]|nr:hypothetical protein [Verrucomicrobiales bacterium]
MNAGHPIAAWGKQAATRCLLFAFGCLSISGVLRAQIQFQFPDEAFKDSSLWDRAVLLDEFRPENAPTRIALKYWDESPVVFGVKSHGIFGRFKGESMTSITVLFLDSGTHFGYVPHRNAAVTERDHRQRFRELFTKNSASIEAGLKRLSNGGEGEEITIGKTPMMEQKVRVFKTGDLYARYHKIEEQLLKVTWFRSEQAARGWADPGFSNLKPESIAAHFASKIERRGNGDVVLNDVPLLPQGDRAYCGVSALSMAMQYLGMLAETEDYAAAAGIRYGSTKGSFIREVYDAAGQESGFQMERSRQLDAKRLQESLNAGIPVVVWRRWNQQRDFLHSVFARKYRKNGEEEVLPPADVEDRANWPGEGAFNHASVITGYNEKRGEVIFTESWSEAVRNRRMRIEEMVGTTYYAFYFSL